MLPSPPLRRVFVVLSSIFTMIGLHLLHLFISLLYRCFAFCSCPSCKHFRAYKLAKAHDVGYLITRWLLWQASQRSTPPQVLQNIQRLYREERGPAVSFLLGSRPCTVSSRLTQRWNKSSLVGWYFCVRFECEIDLCRPYPPACLRACLRAVLLSPLGGRTFRATVLFPQKQFLPNGGRPAANAAGSSRAKECRVSSPRCERGRVR